MEKETLKISFDNAGGITLETSKYCHFYNEPRDAAEDAAFILDGMSTEEWAGNESEHRGVRAETQHLFDDVMTFISAPFDEENHRGIAEIEFYKTIKGE